MFSFLEQFWHGRARINLQEKLATVNLKVDDRVITDFVLPTLIAHGDESAGKSTLLEQLIQFDIFDVGKDMITRMVWIYRLRYSANQSPPKVIVKMANKPFLETSDPAVVKSVIQEAHNDIKKSGVAILDQEGIIEIFSNLVPNIDIIDLPGSVASPKVGEPSNLVETSRKIAKKYLMRPNHIIMYVQSSTTLQRNSVAAGLLCECKCANVISVLTKVDRAIDMRTHEPLAEFMEMFRARDENCIAVTNYLSHPNISFAEVREEEMKFFHDYISAEDFETYKHRLGMPALMHRINQLAESMNKQDWVNARLKIEQGKLANVKMQLEMIGPLYSTQELCAIVADGLVENDPMWLDTIKDVWDEMKFPFPYKVEYWTTFSEFDTNRFLNNMQTRILAQFDRLFERSPHKLARFELFQAEYRRLLMHKLSTRVQSFQARWTELVKHILMDYFTGSAFYSPDRWLHTLKMCYVQHVLMKLNDPDEFDRQSNRQSPFYMHFPLGSLSFADEQEIGPPPPVTLKSTLEAIGFGLASDESLRTKKERDELQQQANIFQSIIESLTTQ